MRVTVLLSTSVGRPSAVLSRDMSLVGTNRLHSDSNSSTKSRQRTARSVELMPTVVATQVTPIDMRSTRAVVADVEVIGSSYLEPLLFCVVFAGAGAATGTDGVPAFAAVKPGTGT